MVLIMVTCWIPPHKVAEAGKKFIEVLQKIPFQSFEKPLIPVASRDVKDGIKVISIGEVEKGKYEEGLNLVSRRMVEFYGIEGFRFEIETLMTGEEGMPLIGLEMPSA